MKNLKKIRLGLFTTGILLLCLFYISIFPKSRTTGFLFAQSVPTPTTASGGTGFHVSKTNCNNSWPGTLAQPRCTINSGISLLNSGNTLYIHGGTYNEVVSISRSGTASAPITIDNYQNETVIIDGTYSIPTGSDWDPLVNITGSYVIFRDIEVTRSNGEGISVNGSYSRLINVYAHHNHEAGVILSGNYTVADGNRIYYNSMHNEYGAQLAQGAGWGTGISAARHPSYATIRNTVSWNNWGEGISTFGADHTTLEDNVSYDNWSVNMYIQNVQYALVQRNLIYRTANNIFSTVSNRASETGLVEDNEEGDAQYGISANNIYVNNFVYGNKGNFVHWSGSTGMSNALIANNTFVNTTGRGNVDIEGTNSNVRFQNNLIVQDDSLSIAQGGGGVNFSNNLWSKSPPSNFMGTNSLVGNPMLLRQGSLLPGQLTGSWFTLTSSSPAINKAISLLEVTVDYFKTARPYGPLPDIGAHEYGGIVQPTITQPITPPTATVVQPTRTPTVMPIQPTTQPTIRPGVCVYWKN